MRVMVDVGLILVLLLSIHLCPIRPTIIHCEVEIMKYYHSL